MTSTVLLDGVSLSREQLVSVARGASQSQFVPCETDSPSMELVFAVAAHRASAPQVKLFGERHLVFVALEPLEASVDRDMQALPCGE